MQEIFDFAGSEFNDDHEIAIRKEMRVSKPNKFGKHVYRLGDYFSPSEARMEALDFASGLPSR